MGAPWTFVLIEWLGRKFRERLIRLEKDEPFVAPVLVSMDGFNKNPNGTFDRALMFDVVEHLYPWELHASLSDIQRVLKPGGMIVVHTAPNRWYDQYAYPFVRLIRRLQGKKYPANPRALNVEANVEVHVNEQSIVSLGQYLRRAGFSHVKVWLNSPPQHRHENIVFRGLRHVFFEWPPFRWFFEREVFAVGVKANS